MPCPGGKRCVFVMFMWLCEGQQTTPPQKVWDSPVPILAQLEACEFVESWYLSVLEAGNMAGALASTAVPNNHQIMTKFGKSFGILVSFSICHTDFAPCFFLSFFFQPMSVSYSDLIASVTGYWNASADPILSNSALFWFTLKLRMN